MSISSSCREFDGIAVNEETMKRAEHCLKLVFLYIDRTVDPPIFRYIEHTDDYEIIGWVWKTEKGVRGDINIDEKVLSSLKDGVYYVIRLKNGKVLLITEDELKHIDTLFKVKRFLDS